MGTVPQGPIGPLTALLRSRHLKRLAAWFVATLVICASLVGITLFRAYGDLSAGRQGLLDARKALSAGNLSEALDRFDRAGERFDLARRKTGGPLGGLAGVIPLLGNDVDVAAALAEGGVLLSGAGAEVTTAISKLPDGFGSLAPANGRFPLEMYTEVGHVLSAARQDAQTALDKVLASPSSFLTGPVLEARWEAESQMREVVTALEATESMLSGLPRFAGADGERTYLVLAQNPAELRGTGGIWGAYALMSLVDGRPRFGSVAPTQSLPDVSSEQVPAPSADYARNYDGFGGAASWHNMNMTPDFPSAAQAAMANYEAATGTPVDGVIAADPFALREMLEVTGPISVPGLDRRIDADNVIPFTTNEAYSLFRGPALRKEVLGEVVKDVVARFLAIEGKGVARMKALSEAFSGGHLLVYSTDAEFQRGLALAGGAGARDLVAVTVNNASGSKIDYYALRRVDYSVILGGDGEALASLETTIRNPAPDSGEPRYVIGPFAKDAEAGDQISFISVSCHDPCELRGASRDGRPVTLERGSELGIPWFRDYQTIGAGQEGSLGVEWKTSGVWDGNSSGGVYRLTFLGQTTIQPTAVRISIEAPAGTQVRWTNVPMAIDGGTAEWAGTVTDVLELEVRFRAPVPVAWWRTLNRAL